MTDEEFGVIKAELERLSRGLTEAVRHIIHQEAEITALEWIIEKNGLVIPGEFDVAREEAIRQLSVPVERTGATGVDDVPRKLRRPREKWRM